ncbi:DBH-like monooxygenase protein 1 homolog [Penaeus vannamei]|uniref:DBH-like monooxygenase protein 1 homolog n=1 Tax=Penaeus vannamei TaxID=6689 RepID=UPI00387F57D3
MAMSWCAGVLLLLTACGTCLGEEAPTANATYLEKRQEHEAAKMSSGETDEEALFIRLPHSARVDDEGKFHLSWAVDIERQEITLELSVETLGWVGFGVSPNGAMDGADILTGWVDEDGVGHIQDRHGTGNVKPEMDEQQDWRLLRASENETHTVMVVVRDLSTCDDKDMPFMNTTKRVIYAYADEDPANETALQYHGSSKSGSRYLVLLEPQSEVMEMPEDAKKWTIIQKHTLSSDWDTVYWCNIATFPHKESQVHYVGFNIQHGKNSRTHLHHVVIWECTGDANSAAYSQERERLMHYASQEGHECLSPNMPPDYAKCDHPTIVWSSGIEGEREPVHVGMPLVSAPGEHAFFMVEAHYDNPALVDNAVVEWGIDVYYTEELREFESGSLMVGSSLNFGMVIPPAQAQWSATGHCPAGCLVEGMPESGIKVYQILPHAHIIGRSIRVRHFRDGKELPPLAVDDYYDFNFQQILRLQEERTILPSDHITTECTFDSSSRQNATFSGYGSRDEMCQAFLFYYPRRSLVQCSSASHHNVVKEVLGIQELQNEDNMLLLSSDRDQINPFLPKKKTDFKSFVNSINWSEMDLEEAEQKLTHGTHVTRCLKRGGVPAQAFKLKTGYPDAEPYKAPEDSCPRMLSQRTSHAVEASTSASSGASTSYISLTCIALAILRQILAK